eukprot:1028676-Prorocentrum_minimum.AAC.5
MGSSGVVSLGATRGTKKQKPEAPLGSQLRHLAATSDGFIVVRFNFLPRVILFFSRLCVRVGRA